MDNIQDSRQHDVNPLLIGLLGVIAGAIIVATLHFMILGWCTTEERRHESSENERNSQTSNTTRDLVASSSSGMSNSSVQLIPIFKYTKGFNGGSCVICLGEFKENDRIRVLPECSHHFHVPCIDKWLFSHPNCPLCRMDIVPHVPDQHVSVVDDTQGINVVVPSQIENVATSSSSENDSNIVNISVEHSVGISSPDDGAISTPEIPVVDH